MKSLNNSQLLKIYRRVATRYDFQHRLLTAGSDQRGRRILVNNAVCEGASVLDAGAGTGSTGLLAAKVVGSSGKVTLFDLSDDMLTVAKQKAIALGMAGRVLFQTGDMLSLPFPDNTFDTVLSSYSLCPLYDPKRGALELLRVLKPGGRLGIAHSSEPHNPGIRWLAEKVERLVWRLPTVSMGCRAISVLPAIKSTGAKVILHRYIGVPFWPFEVIIVEK